MIQDDVAAWARGNPGRTAQECADALGIGLAAAYGAARRAGVTFARKPREAVPEDLTGRRFGRLVATERTRKNRRDAYVCRCDCGREAVVTATDLVSGRRSQCGAWDHGILGQRFGRLTVEAYEGPDRGNGTRFRCRCDCGREAVVGSKALKSGNTRSCGCGERENRAGIYARMGGRIHAEGTNLAMIGTGRTGPRNTSGHVGVMPYKGRWRAYISFQGTRHHLGDYDDVDTAVKARLEAERILHDPVRAKHGYPVAEEMERLREKWRAENERRTLTGRGKDKDG